MTRKKKRKRTSLASPSCFVFTPETVRMTQEALQRLEQPLSRADHQDGKVAFAAEEMERIKAKLDIMRTSVGRMVLTTFDYNERIMLVAAIQMYSVDLRSQPSTPRREKELKQCRQITAHFALGHPNEEKRSRRTP
jgi:hypothetical protein